MAKRITVDGIGEIIDYGLNSTIILVCCFVRGLSTSGNGEGGSEQIREGAQEIAERRFLFNTTGVAMGRMIRESRWAP